MESGNYRKSSRIVAAALILSLAACQKGVPVECSRRESILGQGYVVIVRNKTDQVLSLWIESKEQRRYFTLRPRDSSELGWLEGFHFGANSTYSIGGEGFSTQAFSTGDG